MYVKVMPGGRLHLTKWTYNKKKKRGKYKTVDVTDKVMNYLFWPHCKLHRKVVLRDIFLLVERNLSICTVLIHPYIDEFIEEGLYHETEKDTEIEYLELYYSGEIFEKRLEGMTFPGFHGIGYKKDGWRQPWSLMFSKTNDLVGLPLKLGRMEIFDDAIEDPLNRLVFKNKKVDFSLGAIIYGIFWELSYSGKPSDRDKKNEMLNESYNKARKQLNEKAIDS
jgi:hypothetical protein